MLAGREFMVKPTGTVDLNLHFAVFVANKFPFDFSFVIFPLRFFNGDIVEFLGLLLADRLRQRFIDDLNLAGRTSKTQEAYIRAVLKCVRCYGNIPPQRMSEQQVEAYIRQRHLQVARGTFQADFAALKALFYRTPRRDWAIFAKKKFPRRIFGN